MKTTILVSLTIALIICVAFSAKGQDATLFLDDLGLEELPAADESEVEPLPNPSQTADPEPETIRERYDNRRVKIERDVVQDEDQNYINHGKWKMWDNQGNLVMEGRYSYNQREGVWKRIYRRRDAKLLSIPPFNQAQLPIVSQANFKDGEIDGKWIIYDANNKTLSDWEFTDGRRDGRSTWFYVTGRKMREISYTDGSIDGQLNEWDRNGQQVTRDHYDDGRRLAKKTEYYRDRSKKSEGSVLYPRLVLDKADDWEECTLATYTQEGKPEKHGGWISWYANGQRKLEGQYQHDTPTGQFVWWHQNGQKWLQASYDMGKKHGQWTWWHSNGQKSIQGEYLGDDPTSKWLWWEQSGKVAQRADFSDPNQQQILAMPPNSGESLGSPSAILPALDRALK